MDIKYREELKKQYDYVRNSLSAIEAIALKQYTTEYYKDINAFLRKEKKFISPTHKDILETIDGVFANIPSIRRAVTLYRGVPIKSFDNRTFISTSYDIDTARAFMENDCCMFVLTATPGSKVIPLMTISAHRYEEEFLIERDSNYRITASGVEDGVFTVYVSIEPPGSHNITPTLAPQLIQVERKNYDEMIVKAAKELMSEEIEDDIFGEPDQDDIIEALKHTFNAYYQRSANKDEIVNLLNIYHNSI